MSTGLPYRDFLGTETVRLYIGSSRVEYTIHLSLLSACTPIFARMFSTNSAIGGFLESQTKTASLPDDSEKVFDQFAAWLYSNNPALTTPKPNSSPSLPLLDISLSTATSGPIWERLELYLFAQKYCIDALSDACIDSIRLAFKAQTDYPSTEAILMVYANTSSSAGLRLYIARTLAYCLTVVKPKTLTLADLTLLAGVNSGDFAADVFRVLLEEKKGESVKHPNEYPVCDYHSHRKGKLCDTAMQVLEEKKKQTPIFTPQTTGSHSEWEVDDAALDYALLEGVSGDRDAEARLASVRARRLSAEARVARLRTTIQY